MIKKVILLSALLGATVSSAQTLSYDATAVKTECSAEWGTEYDMVKYCIDQRKSGHSSFSRIVTGMPEGLLAAMRPTIELCESEWQQEWNMTDYCLKQHMEAVMEMPSIIEGLPKQIADIISQDCANEWRAEFNMVAYCMKRRADGWRSINE